MRMVDFILEITIETVVVMVIAFAITFGSVNLMTWLWPAPAMVQTQWPFPEPTDRAWTVTFSEPNEFGQLSEIRKYRSNKVVGEMWLLDGKPVRASFFIDPSNQE